jgi:hypothetical protein
MRFPGARCITYQACTDAARASHCPGRPAFATAHSTRAQAAAADSTDGDAGGAAR